MLRLNFVLKLWFALGFHSAFFLFFIYKDGSKCKQWWGLSFSKVCGPMRGKTDKKYNFFFNFKVIVYTTSRLAHSQASCFRSSSRLVRSDEKRE